LRYHLISITTVLLCFTSFCLTYYTACYKDISTYTFLTQLTLYFIQCFQLTDHIKPPVLHVPRVLTVLCIQNGDQY